MLVRLLIKNYALIDNLDISFDKGLNIITGETGAGKSILMGALGLVLGNRAEGRQFFSEEKKCIIEGYFNISSFGLKEYFDELDLEFEEETIIRRELSIDGKSRAFVNDSPVTLATLKLLGEKLIDIHSQHATLQINTEEFQFFVLDAISSNQEILSNYQGELKKLRKLDKDIQALQDDLKNAQTEYDYNQYLFEELEKVNVQLGEVIALEDEQRQLENAEDIKKGLLASNYLLSDGEHNVLALLKEGIQQVQSAGKYFSDAEVLSSRLQSAYIELKDVSNEITNHESSIQLDERRLVEVNNRLSDIYSLLKKHRLESDEELISLKTSIEDKLGMVSGYDDQLEKLNEERKERFELVLQLAETLYKNRLAVLPSLEKEVEQILAHVGMANAQLKVELKRVEHISRFTSKGMDSVQFLFSANKGQALQPIHKVASGGELSRVMLAIKSLVAKNSALPTIVFDEIDTGISGEVALRVGEVMNSLSQHMQVIAITHLPQIASKGQAHFKVYKEDKNDKTHSNIIPLSYDQRILEIAQMLSGVNPGEAALEHAKTLLI